MSSRLLLLLLLFLFCSVALEFGEEEEGKLCQATFFTSTPCRQADCSPRSFSRSSSSSCNHKSITRRVHFLTWLHGSYHQPEFRPTLIIRFIGGLHLLLLPPPPRENSMRGGGVECRSCCGRSRSAFRLEIPSPSTTFPFFPSSLSCSLFPFLDARASSSPSSSCIANGKITVRTFVLKEEK